MDTKQPCFAKLRVVRTLGALHWARLLSWCVLVRHFARQLIQFTVLFVSRVCLRGAPWRLLSMGLLHCRRDHSALFSLHAWTLIILTLESNAPRKVKNAIRSYPMWTHVTRDTVWAVRYNYVIERCTQELFTHHYTGFCLCTVNCLQMVTKPFTFP